MKWTLSAILTCTVFIGASCIPLRQNPDGTYSPVLPERKLSDLAGQWVGTSRNPVMVWVAMLRIEPDGTGELSTARAGDDIDHFKITKTVIKGQSFEFTVADMEGQDTIQGGFTGLDKTIAVLLLKDNEESAVFFRPAKEFDKQYEMLKKHMNVKAEEAGKLRLTPAGIEAKQK